MKTLELSPIEARLLKEAIDHYAHDLENQTCGGENCPGTREEIERLRELKQRICKAPVRP